MGFGSRLGLPGSPIDHSALNSRALSSPVSKSNGPGHACAGRPGGWIGPVGVPSVRLDQAVLLDRRKSLGWLLLGNSKGHQRRRAMHQAPGQSPSALAPRALSWVASLGDHGRPRSCRDLVSVSKVLWSECLWLFRADWRPSCPLPPPFGTAGSPPEPSLSQLTPFEARDAVRQ